MHEALLAALPSWQARIQLGANHRYKADGEYKAGTTTAIKVMDAPDLDRWTVRVQIEGTARAAYANPPLANESLDGYVARLKKLGEAEYEHERLSDEAASIGRDVHSLIEHAVKKMLGQETEAPSVCEEALFRFAGWREWAHEKGLKPLASEIRVFNEAYDYCGTVDLLAIIDGEVSVVDFKPTKVVYPERRLQLAAYRMALREMGWPTPRGFINCLPRDGGDIQMIEIDPPGVDLEMSFAAFRYCLDLYRWLGELERKARKQRKVA